MKTDELRAAYAADHGAARSYAGGAYGGTAVRRKVLLDGTVDEILNQTDYVNKAARVIDLLDIEARAIERELRSKEAA